MTGAAVASGTVVVLSILFRAMDRVLGDRTPTGPVHQLLYGRTPAFTAIARATKPALIVFVASLAVVAVSAAMT